MGKQSHAAKVGSLIDRLDASKAFLEAVLEEREDKELTDSLEHGSYGTKELDLLFELIKEPLLSSVVMWAGGMRDHPEISGPNFGGRDPFFLALVLLSRGEHRSADDDVPRIDLLDSGSDEQASLGRAGAAQIELLRRLVHCYGFEGLQSKIKAFAVNREMSFPQAKSADEVARLLRLVAPIERDHDCALLSFVSPTGQFVDSRFYGFTQTVRESYMSVDK